MRKVTFLILAVFLLLASCVKPEEFNELKEKFDALEGRLAAVETNLNNLNTTTSGIQTAVTALQGKVTVESVEEISDGYIIHFTGGKTATIKNGKNGDDGKDATAPTVGVKEVDGELVWTVNGEVVKDATGKAVPATVKVPEFKFENNKWWYRFGEADTWKDCGEKTGPEPSITETDEFVIISIGDKSIQIPKEVISPAIEAITPVITIGAKRLFVPVGKTIDLKDWFEVAPEGALKTMVEYSFGDGAPFTIDDKGILTATGEGNFTVTITSKVNPELSTSLAIRTADTPNNEEPARAINPDNKLVLFEGSLAEYNTLLDFGGSTSWNPFNNSIAGIVNGTLNTRFAVPVKEDATITRENGHLHFMFYIDDIANIHPDNLELVELTNGTWDHFEIHWNNSIFGSMKSGWNEVDLAFRDAGDETQNGQLLEPFDPTKPSFFRVVVPASGPDGSWAAFQIKDFFVYAEEGVKINPVITIGANRLFVPVGKSIDLKNWFTITPASAEVTYSFGDGAPFTISDAGVLTATGEGNFTVTIASKKDPEVKTDIAIRTADTPNNEEPARAINPDDKLVLFEGSLEEYNTFLDFGGSTSFNPFNNSIAGIVNGTLNTRFAVPVKENANITRQNGHLHFMFYIDDIANIHPNNLELVELTNGTWDHFEIHWNNSIFSSMKSGWNEVDLAFKDAGDETQNGQLLEPFDPTKPSFFRVVVPASGPDGSWASFQVKDFFVYAEEEAVKVTIDGDMSEWAKIKGVETPDNICKVMKVTNDDDNFYVYLASAPGSRGSQLWGDEAGYYYVDFDWDNNEGTGIAENKNPGFDCWFYMYVFGGTADAPIIKEHPNGSGEKMKIENITAKGVITSDLIEIELSIPRADMVPVQAGAQTRILSWRSKDGTKITQIYTVK